MKKLKLYSRIECPLCEYAEELLLDIGLDYELVYIDDSDDLIQLYHVRVPVLANDHRELNWPFNAQQAKALVQEQVNG